LLGGKKKLHCPQRAGGHSRRARMTIESGGTDHLQATLINLTAEKVPQQRILKKKENNLDYQSPESILFFHHHV
jgi:hypothetical protein